MFESAEELYPWKEHWEIGETPFFEYHCWESHDSADADLWYRSHQRVTVLGEGDHDGKGMTFEERCEAGHPKVYRIRFVDGHEGYALDDELMEDSSGFCRPDPPEPRKSK